MQVVKLRKSIRPACLTDPLVSHGKIRGNLKMWSLSNTSEQLVVIEPQQMICGRCCLLDTMVEMLGTKVMVLDLPLLSPKACVSLRKRAIFFTMLSDTTFFSLSQQWGSKSDHLHPPLCWQTLVETRLSAYKLIMSCKKTWIAAWAGGIGISVSPNAEYLDNEKRGQRDLFRWHQTKNSHGRFFHTMFHRRIGWAVD